MCNKRPWVICMVLAFAAMSISLAQAGTTGPPVKGTLYETDGTLLKSVIVNVTVTDSAGTAIGSAASDLTTATYAIKWNAKPLADNLMNITYKRTNGTASLTYNRLSWTALGQNICPIVPK